MSSSRDSYVIIPVMQCVMVTVATGSSRAQRFVLMRLVTFILGAVAGASKMMTVSGRYSHRVLWRVTGSLCPFLPPDGLLFPLARIMRVDEILSCLIDSSMPSWF